MKEQYRSADSNHVGQTSVMMMAGLINRVLLSVALLGFFMAACFPEELNRQQWIIERYSGPLFAPNGESLMVQAFVPPRNEEIFLLLADGTEVRNLTQHPAADSYPRWSPDGRSILFLSDRNGRDAMFRMNSDGRGVTKIPGLVSSLLGMPSWSPDGKSIVFKGKEGITVSAADGSRPRVLVRQGRDPIWSPDGNLILYWVFPQWDMRVVSVDGTEDRRISGGVPLTWTPDGRAIFYESPWVGQGKPQHVYRVNADGSDPRMVLENVKLSGYVADAARLWSPDGSRLALAVELSIGSHHNTGIVILDPDGQIVRDFRKAEWFLYDSTLSWRDNHTLTFSRLYLSPRIESKLPKDSGGVYLLNTDTGDIRHVIRNKAMWIDPRNPPW